jgi:hypothetical protein
MRPRDRGAGYSAYTATKLAHLRDVLRLLLGIHRRNLEKPWCDPRMLIVDSTSGPGDPGGLDGSPLICTQLAAQLGVPLQHVLCDRHPEAIASVRQLCPHATVLEGDHADTIPAWIAAQSPGRKRAGVFLFDGNGGDPLPTATIEAFYAAAKHSMVDLVANVAANDGYKRQQRAERLLHDLERIPKKDVLVRGVVPNAGDRGHQWAMVVATNYPPLSWKGLRFKRLDTDAGRSIVLSLSYTPDELLGMTQPRLGDV